MAPCRKLRNRGLQRGRSGVGVGVDEGNSAIARYPAARERTARRYLYKSDEVNKCCDVSGEEKV
eukprot:scaffold832_cov75-Skeletonema_dohrnii-CCMP3373.AAC.2